MVLQQKPLEKADFMVIITGPVMVRPASSDKWKAPLDSPKRRGNLIKITSSALWRWFNRFDRFSSIFWAMNVLFFDLLTKRINKISIRRLIRVVEGIPPPPLRHIFNTFPSTPLFCFLSTC